MNDSYAAFNRPVTLKADNMKVNSGLVKAITLLFLLACHVLAPQFARGEWQAHQIRQGDGEGGWVARPALRQVLKHPDSEFTMPFSLAQMGNGEIAILVSREKAKPGGGRIVEPKAEAARQDLFTRPLSQKTDLKRVWPTPA